MRQFFLIMLLITGFVYFSEKETVSAYGPACFEEEGMIKCHYPNGNWTLRCNPNLDDTELEQCRENIKEFNRERKYYRNLYNRKCNYNYNKRTEFCQELKEKYQTYLF